MPPKPKDQFLEVDPNDIFFTHSKIRPYFSCGRAVQHTLEAIQTGKLSVSDLPRITVISQDGHYFSLNNRRLWVMKQCREKGLITTVLARVQPVQPGKRLANRFTPEKCAKSAKFFSELSDSARGGSTSGGDSGDSYEASEESIMKDGEAADHHRPKRDSHKSNHKDAEHDEKETNESKRRPRRKPKEGEADETNKDKVEGEHVVDNVAARHRKVKHKTRKHNRDPLDASQDADSEQSA